MRQWTNGFAKMRVISSLADELPVSRYSLCSTKKQNRSWDHRICIRVHQTASVHQWNVQYLLPTKELSVLREVKCRNCTSMTVSRTGTSHGVRRKSDQTIPTHVRYFDWSFDRSGRYIWKTERDGLMGKRQKERKRDFNISKLQVDCFCIDSVILL
jgi:hypothetical protein